jgi:hypothetical protein
LSSLFSSPFPIPPSTRWLTWVPILPSSCRKHQLNIYTSMGPCCPACCTLCPGPTPHHLHNILLSIGNCLKVWNGNYPCDHHLTSLNCIIDICKSWVGSWKNQSDYNRTRAMVAKVFKMYYWILLLLSLDCSDLTILKVL